MVCARFGVPDPLYDDVLRMQAFSLRAGRIARAAHDNNNGGDMKIAASLRSSQ